MADLLRTFLDPPWLAHVAAALAHCGLLLALVLTVAAVSIWAERKVSARMQDRLGPTRVGGRFGWLQSLADGLKLLAKEEAHRYEVQAIRFNDLSARAKESGFMLFIVNGSGDVLEKIAP